MKRFAGISLAIIASSIALPTLAQNKLPVAVGTGMKPGVWEVVSVIQPPDAKVKKTVTSRLCYAAADVATASRVLPPQRGLGLQCVAADVKAADASAWSWKLTCNGTEGAYSGTGSLRPASTNYSAQVSLEQKRGAKGGGRIDQTVTGRWISDCT